MAVKHVQEYYNQVVRDYMDMRHELQDMEDLYAENMVSPEMVEQMRQMIQPLKNNYETLSYFMFLLNQPTKKQKQARYASQNKQLLKHCKTEEQVLQENRQVLVALEAQKEVK